MINITPTSHYSTNFKAKTDYSKIYKEMEKISVRRDEKIIPKVKIKDKFTDRKAIWEDRIDDLKDKWHNKWETFHFNVMRHFLLPLYVSTSTLLGVAGYMLIKPLLNGEKIVRIVNNDTNINSQSSPQNLEKNLTATADSLETLLNDSTISFEEYRKQMNDAIEEYDVYAHLQLFKQNGFRTYNNDIQNIKHGYAHDNYGHLIAIDPYRNKTQMTNIDCSKVDKNIEILNKKLDFYKSKEINDSIAIELE